MTIHIYLIMAIFSFMILIFSHFAASRWIHFETRTTIKKGEQQDERAYLIVFALLAFALRALLCSKFVERGDVSAFATWSNEAYTEGLKQFYSTHGATTYPPLYILILYVIGVIQHLFDITYMSVSHIVLLKLPSIIMDIAAGVFIYQISRKRFTHSASIILASLVWFNPAILFNSTIWGQVDIFYSFCIVLMCYYLYKKKLIPAFIIFAISFLLKSQTIIFTPVLICGFIDLVLLDNFSYKKLRNYLLGILGAVLLVIGIYLPFVLTSNSGNTIVDAVKQFLSSLTAFAYASMNAFNFWTMIGLNLKDQNTNFLFMPAVSWGYLAIVVLAIGCFVISFRCKKNTAKYPLMGAYLITTMFLFSVRMHERYLFPALLLLLLTYVVAPRKEWLYVLGSMSALHFANTFYILYVRPHALYTYSKNMIPIFISAMTIAVWGYMLVLIKRYYRSELFYEQATDPLYLADMERQTNKASARTSKKHSKKQVPVTSKNTTVNEQKPFHVFTGRTFTKLRWFDFAIIIAVTIIYAFIAFHDLGSTNTPNTTWEATNEDYIIELDFGKDVHLGQLNYFTGGYESRSFTVSLRSDGTEDIDSSWTTKQPLTTQYPYSWEIYQIYTPARYVRIQADYLPSELTELVFKDLDGNVLTPTVSDAHKSLLDEQDKYVEKATFRDEMYFDEIYHGRTAYEYIEEKTTYETTHPPLGKILISVGIRLFGMNPFGWRFMGTLFGVLMLPFIYLFAKRMFNKTWIASIVMLLFAFDFMHFTQSRIATIDVYITFFIILMYYFMYRYISMSYYTSKLWKTFIPLGLCGISMGLGVASKWTGVYAGIGLAIIFFYHLFKRYMEYRYAKEHPGLTTDGVEHDMIAKTFIPHTIKTLVFCIVFFICIPLTIYGLSYIPFVGSDTDNTLIENILENQEYMLTYHSDLDTTHPYESRWYEWPMMVKPILYYSENITSTTAEGITAMGNPLVWWVGALSMCYLAYRAIKYREAKSGFICLGFLAQYLPWAFISRSTFIYHYFTSVPFLVLAIGYSIYKIHAGMKEEKARKRFFIGSWIYCICAIGLFIYFYPVIAGQPIEIDSLERTYRWFSQWYFIVT